MNLELHEWKAEDYLKTPDEVRAYLQSAYKDGFDEFRMALDNVAKSEGGTNYKIMCAKWSTLFIMFHSKNFV